jgi:DNA helicase-2/ATP-dependent DNA helicase PcrA
LSMQYNDAQQRAVEHTEGPMLVLAGPGSGKTSVITGRVCRLIEKGISPSHVLVATFTRAAAAEMKGRFLLRMGQDRTPVTFGTFHGIFFGILRQAYRIDGRNILGDDARLRLIGEILDSCTGGGDREPDLPAAVGREISRVKESRMNLEHFYSAALPEEEFRKVYREYGRWMTANRKLDFDDIGLWCWKLFTERPEILRLWQRKFRYLLIDEFQDINPLQYDIVRTLAEPERNLFIVGDDDQSIYRFRGATPEIMLGFPRDYPETETVTLNVNYRCTPQILKCAERLIAGNKKRFRKELKTVREDGDPVEFRLFSDAGSEAEHLARELRKAAEAGESYENAAVLFRTNTGCRAAVERLMAWQIPFRVRDHVPCLYDHWIASDIFAYLHLGEGGRKRGDFLRICNRPNRYLNREAFSDSQVSFEELYQYYEDREWMWERIEKLETDIKALERLSPYGAVQYIRHGIGYEQYVKEYALARKIPEEELIQILDELSESARSFRSREEWFAHIRLFREELQKKNADGKPGNGVTVSTLHGVKGMEYDRVYILDINEGIIPWQKAVLEADLEEERRMLYVGMTRARKELHLYAVKERYGKKTEVSRFLSDILPSGGREEKHGGGSRRTGGN